jgi:DNA-binding CsgD family transcriptional regulator
MPSSGPSTPSIPKELPLIGRADDLDRLYRLFGDSGEIEPFAMLKGDGGVGKSRLAATVAAEAERRGWRVITGRAFPVETGAPFALISDAFVPLLRGMEEATLTVLTRGTQDELRRLFPALGPASGREMQGADPGEKQARLFWHFSDMLGALADRTPLLVVLEDLQWADASSLSLLHFAVRHLGEAPLRILSTCNTEYREGAERLLPMERSLVSLGRLHLVPLSPLSIEDTRELVETVFGTSGPPVREFSDVLYGWTRGNPFFIEETLRALVAAGRLHHRDGTWLGWGARELELPSSIRDAISARLTDLSDQARAVADVLAVAGAPIGVDVLERVTDLSSGEVASAVEELQRPGLVEESRAGRHVELRFRHPLGREALHQRLSLTRCRGLHRAIADALEQVHGDAALEHADEIAYHLVQAGSAGDELRTVGYLAEAGRGALNRHADREAVDYLEMAASLVARDGGSSGIDPLELHRLLVRARARVGRYEDAEEVATELLRAVEESGEPEEIAGAHRRLGLLAFWMGRHEVALERYAAARLALGDRAPGLRARLHANAGLALQELGRSEEGREQVRLALELAEELDDVALLGRVHRGLALLATFTGDVEQARFHARRAVEFGDRSGDGHVAFWGRWVLASVEGLSRGPVGIAEPLRDARAAADELRNPVLSLWVTELEVEQAYFGGDWDRALALGERGVNRAATLNQRPLEVRILVWTAMCYFGRGDRERGAALVERACRAAGLGDGGSRRPDDVHALIPAYIGRTALALAQGEFESAVEIGLEGLELADRVGYEIWKVHRLMPLVAEAYIELRRADDVAAVSRKLREDGERMHHPLALAYADAGDALAAWRAGRIEEAADLLRDAAESLEAIGIVPEAARVRREIAARLIELDRRDEALAELRRVHEIFGRLGARPELEKTRAQFRQLDARPPSRVVAEGTAELTGRETEIAALVAGRRSNKAVAKALGISPRTVTTHLSNIYRKLGVGSRGELVDMVREGRLGLEPAD